MLTTPRAMNWETPIRSNVHRLIHLTVVYGRTMAKRLSLILGDQEQRQLEPFVSPGTRQREVLQRWMADRGEGPVRSEAAVIRALLRAGVESLSDDVLDVGYAQLAASYDNDGKQDERLVARDRYVERTDASA